MAAPGRGPRAASRSGALRRWLPAAVLSGLALLAGGCSPPPAAPRNVVVVLVDTLRADHLELYGYSRETAPQLTRLAREGVVFERARSQAGCTFPSVNSILTSRHPVRFLDRIDDFGMAIPGDTPALAEILRRHGFTTAAVSASLIVRDTPSKVNRQGGFGRGFDRFDESCVEKRAPCVNRVAFELLEELPEPFFLYLHYLEPHAPYRPPPWHPRRFATGRPDRSWVAQGDPQRIFRKLYEGADVPFEESDLAHFVDLYDEEIFFFDGQLAALFDRLEASGRRQRTLVALLSDHGEELLDHGEFGHCRDMAYETLLATPLVLWIPGVEPAARKLVQSPIRTPVRNLDLVPTVLDYLGVGFEEGAFEGRSLRPLIEGRKPAPGARPELDFAAQGTMRTVTGGAVKLIHDLETGRSRLYDLRTDPGERTDLAGERPELARRLEELLLAWLEDREGGLDPVAAVRRAREHEAQLRALGYL